MIPGHESVGAGIDRALVLPLFDCVSLPLPTSSGGAGKSAEISDEDAGCQWLIVPLKRSDSASRVHGFKIFRGNLGISGSQLPETPTINYSELCQAAVRVMLARHN